MISSKLYLMIQKLLQQHPHWPIVEKIAGELMQRGHRVVLAGGCVRDALLGVLAQDLDIATDATPEQVETYFERVLFIGKSFGVCRVVDNGASIEVATFREEDEYSDGRRPDKVVYSTLEKDVLRRDFTINAMFFDFKSGDIIDLAGGREDLAKKQIRTVGEAQKRFSEDYLRILRAARLVAQLGFHLETNTSTAMAALAKNVKQLSKERIHDEIEKALKSQRPFLFFEILDRANVHRELFPEVPWRGDFTYNAKKKLGAEFFQEMFGGPLPTPAVGWASLAWTRALKSGNPDFHLVDVVYTADWLKGFKLSQKNIADVQAILNSQKFFNPSANRLKEFIAMVKSGQLSAILFFWEKLTTVFELPESYVQDLKSFSAKFAPTGSLALPSVGGEDLISKGIAPGEAFKTLLDKTYWHQLENPQMSKDELLRFALALKK